MTEEAIQTSSSVLGKRLVKTPSLPCEALQLVGGNTVDCMTEALNVWRRDISRLTLCQDAGRRATWRSSRRRHARIRGGALPHRFCDDFPEIGSRRFAAWGQDPPPGEQDQLLHLQRGRGCVPGPDAIALAGERVGCTALHPAGQRFRRFLHGPHRRRLERPSAEARHPGSLPITRLLLGVGHTIGWSTAQRRHRRISLRK